jgi:hypothetical protein
MLVGPEYRAVGQGLIGQRKTAATPLPPTLAVVLRSAKSPVTAVVATKLFWGTAVTGDVILIGSAPSFHAPVDGIAGAANLIDDGIQFAASSAAKACTYMPKRRLRAALAELALGGVVDRVNHHLGGWAADYQHANRRSDRFTSSSRARRPGPHVGVLIDAVVLDRLDRLYRPRQSIIEAHRSTFNSRLN